MVKELTISVPMHSAPPVKIKISWDNGYYKISLSRGGYYTVTAHEVIISHYDLISKEPLELAGVEFIPAWEKSFTLTESFVTSGMFVKGIILTMENLNQDSLDRITKTLCNLQVAIKKFGNDLNPVANIFLTLDTHTKDPMSSLPGVNEIVACPVTNQRVELMKVIIYLNDVAGWDRGRIADWIETLDIDTSFKIS